MSVIPYDDTRKDWGARAPKNGGHTFVGKDAKVGVTAHWAGYPVHIEPSDSHLKCLHLVRSWQDFHMDGRGWRDIGYQTLVCVHGRIIEGSANGPYTAGACNAGANTPWTCVQFMRGQGDQTGLNAKMKAAGKRVYDALVKDTGRQLKRNGHRNVVDTECPGDEIYAWWTAPTLKTEENILSNIPKDDLKAIGKAVVSALTTEKAFRVHSIVDAVGAPLPDTTPKYGTLEYAIWCAVRDGRQGRDLALLLAGGQEKFEEVVKDALAANPGGSDPQAIARAILQALGQLGGSDGEVTA